jgi:2-keto-4-pentenoate hydratase
MLHSSIAEAFVRARRTGGTLTDYPGPRPTTLADAYRIQDAALRLDGRTIGGWKVGRIAEPDAARLGSNRLAGPIFADAMFEAAAEGTAPMAAFPGGFIALEAEFMLRLRVPPGAALPRDDAQTYDWVDEVRVGIEVASSPFAGINDGGPCVIVSDFGNNAGALLGPAIADWRARDLRTIEVSMEVPGRDPVRATAQSMLDGPYGAVRFLLEHLRERGIAPQSGWWVSSGAVTGVHVARIGEGAVARFAGIGSLACRLIAAHG